MDNQIEIIEKDITNLLGEKVVICILQLKSPFFDECSIKLVSGHNLLTWDSTKLKKRKEKILAILKKVIEYRKDLNIIVLPEYAIHYEMIEDLQAFSNTNNIILVSTFYDDRQVISNKKNESFRRNVLSVILPKDKFAENILKIEKTSYEANFVSDPPEGEKPKIAKFCWSIDGVNQLYFQVFICDDFLEYFSKVDRERGGIIIVSMCSPEIKEFEAPARLCVRPHRQSKNNRCVILCNSVSLPEQQTDIKMIGCSQVYGPYQGTLPKLGTNLEGGIILTVKAINIITKPSAIPSGFNIVIEDPVSFTLREEAGEWHIHESTPIKKKRWVINPKVFTAMGLGTYFIFARLRNYYNFRHILEKSYTKCLGIAGHDDLVIKCLAEDETDARMFFYGGRSDIAATCEDLTYFYVARDEGYIKYKGFRVDNKPLDVSQEYIMQHKDQIYNLVSGKLNGQDTSLEKLKENEIILGEEEIFDAEYMKTNNQGEFLIGVFLIRMGGGEPCETFESEVLKEYMINNPMVKDIFYSEAGGGKGRIPMHYLLRVVGSLWEVRDFVLNCIHEPLSKRNIEYGTRIMPIIDYVSDEEYEAILDTRLHDPAARRTIREIIDAVRNRYGSELIILKRLPLSDLEKMIRIYSVCEKIANLMIPPVRTTDIKDKVIKMFRGWALGKVKNDVQGVYDDFKDFYTDLSNICEDIVYKNLDKKRKEIGDEKFKKILSEAAGKNIDIEKSAGLGRLLMATSIWNNTQKSDPIIGENYTQKIKELQQKKVDDIRNKFSHRRDPDFLTNSTKLAKQIDSVTDALISLIEFIEEFGSTKVSEQPRDSK